MCNAVKTLLEALHHLRHLLRQYVCQDVDGVCLGFGSRRCCEQDLQQSDLTFRERHHGVIYSLTWKLMAASVDICAIKYSDY